MDKYSPIYKRNTKRQGPSQAWNSDAIGFAREPFFPAFRGWVRSFMGHLEFLSEDTIWGLSFRLAH